VKRTFIRSIAACVTVALIAQAAALPLQAASQGSLPGQPPPRTTALENLQTTFSDGVVTITYDLPASDEPTSFEVSLEVSTNGGQSYDVQPRSMSGDIGRPVSAGRGKRIVWAFAKDIENLQTKQFRFRVVIRIEARAGTSSPASAAPAGELLGGQFPPLTSTRPPAGGNRLLWPGLGMFGAGSAITILAGAGPLRNKTDYPTYYELTPRKPAMYGGIGLAAAGLGLVLLGRRGASRQTVIVPIPGGLMVTRVAEF
jgi:hypothetical protein